MTLISRRAAGAALSTLLLAGSAVLNPVWAADPIKVGLILPMSGPFASTGKQVDAAVKLFLAQNGNKVAGREVEVILKDDTGVAPDTTKRLAQELIVKDNVDILAGFGLTPLALATAPLAEQAKKPMVVMAAASSIITAKAPTATRTSGTLAQSAWAIAQWAAKNNIRKVFSVVTDYSPGIEAETTFKKAFTGSGGTVVEAVRIPLKNPDYGPFLQKAKDAAPDAIFAFLPSGEGASFMKEFGDRGLAKSVKLIATGDVTDDDILPAMGDAAVGTITAHFYSAAHPSPENKAYVAAFEKANAGMRPNFMSVGGYDGIKLIFDVLAKTGGKADADTFIGAAKGMAWTSPRGPVSIEPETRDITQTIYIRKVEKVDGKLYNVEFDQIAAVKDPR